MLRFGVKMGTGATTAFICLALGASQSPAAHASCVPREARLLAHAGLARVYKSEPTGYACRPGVPRIKLGTFFSPDLTTACGEAMGLVRLTPRHVAWRNETYCNELNGWTVKVQRIGRGTKPRIYDTGVYPGGEASGRFGIGPARQIALDDDGRLAWIVQDEAAASPTYEVWRIARRKPRRLARGTDIDPKRLRLVGKRAEWQQAGQLHRG